ncbi:hypothetical protein ACM26W_05610 [Halomonas sp. HK25]
MSTLDDPEARLSRRHADLPVLDDQAVVRDEALVGRPQGQPMAFLEVPAH